MKTPITDEASFSTVYQGEIVEASFARRLELDRAALIQSLERIADICEIKRDKWIAKFIKEALAAARANFPTP